MTQTIHVPTRTAGIGNHWLHSLPSPFSLPLSLPLSPHLSLSPHPLSLSLSHPLSLSSALSHPSLHHPLPPSPPPSLLSRAPRRFLSVADLPVLFPRLQALRLAEGAREAPPREERTQLQLFPVLLHLQPEVAPEEAKSRTSR